MEKSRIFKEGDLVLVDRRNLTLRAGNNRSLMSKWIGPYKVIRNVGTHAYELDIPKGTRLHKVIHTTLLKPFKERAEPQTMEVEEDEDMEFDVEEILNSVRRNGKVLYQIRWEGYGADDDTWEPFEKMTCKDKLRLFHERFPKKPMDSRVKMRKKRGQI